MLLTQAIILDLLARYRTGKGQYVETSLSDEMMYMQAWNTSTLLNVGDNGEDDGRAERRIRAAIRWTGPCFRRQTVSSW